MGGSSKGGSGAGQSNDYYGTVMGTIGIGPMLVVHGILVNGTQVFGDYAAWTDANGNPGYPLVYGSGGVGEGYGLTIAGLGEIIFHWGLESAVQDAVLGAYDNHPPYKGYAYIVLNNCLFGTEQEQPPNIEIIATFGPNQSIVTGTYAAPDSNGWINEAVLAAELATAWHGLGLSSGQINSTSFNTVAASIGADAFLSQLATCSPIWDQTTDARSMFQDCQCMCDLWFRFDVNGLLEIGQWFRGGPAGSVTAITANEWTTPPKDQTDDLTAIPTAFDITFKDYDQLFQETSAPTNNELAIFLGQIGKRQQLRRTMITQVAQAHILGGECLRLLGNQTITGQVAVRATQAVNPDGTPIRPGDYFELDTQQEPGQTAELVLCRCTGRTFDPEGPITLEYEFDPSSYPTPHVISYSVNSPSPNVIPPLYYQRTLSLPPVPGQPASIFALCLRHKPTWIGTQIWYCATIGGDYTQLGNQVGFALPCELQSAIGVSDTTITLNTIGGFAVGVPGNLDVAYLADAVSVDSDTAARNNALLCILIKKNPSGGQEIITSGVPYVEICSVVETAVTGTGQYALTVLRGRMGTAPMAFDTTGGITFPDAFTNYEAWIIPAALLTSLTHTDFGALVASGGTGYFQFAPYTSRDVYSPAAAYAAGLQGGAGWTPTWGYQFPSAYTQAPAITISAPTVPATTAISGAITLTFAVADPTDSISEVQAFSELASNGANFTSYLDQLTSATGSFSWSGSITLPNVEGVHLLTIRVTNAYGVTTSTPLSIYRAVSSSAYSLMPPTVSPVSQPISGQTALTLTAPAGSSGTAQIEVQANGGSWYSFAAGATPVTYYVNAGDTIVARMADTGPVYSALATYFYPNAILGAGTLAGQ